MDFRFKNTQGGFSLVELMIAVTLGLVLIGSVIEVFLGMRQTYVTNRGLSMMQQNARMALDVLTKDFRMIGYLGCDADQKNFVNTVAFDGASTADPAFDMVFDQAVQAYEAKTGSWDPALPGTLDVEPEAGTDAIMFSLIDDPGLRIASSLAADAGSLTVSDASGVSAGDVILVSDCQKAAVFVATAVDTESNLITRGSGDNLDDNLNESNTSFAEDTSIYRVKNTLYFIAPSTFTNNAGTTQLALWRKVNSEDSKQLVVGIESLEVMLGEDTNNNGTVNRYVTADVADMKTVISVRFQIVASSLDTVSGGDLLRRTFTQTVQLRNRGLNNG